MPPRSHESDDSTIPQGGEPRADPRIVPVSQAVDVILARLSATPTDQPRLVHITGPVGAGKSTLSRHLLANRQGALIATDHYLPDYSQVPPQRRDEPDEADLHLLAQNLHTLRRGEPAQVPIWSFQTHCRVGTQIIHPANLIVVEGLFASHPRIAPLANLLVYVSASADTRWQRWEAIELRGERGMGVAAARQHFDAIAEPTFAKYARDYHSAAHLIVTTDGV